MNTSKISLSVDTGMVMHLPNLNGNNADANASLPSYQLTAEANDTRLPSLDYHVESHTSEKKRKKKKKSRRREREEREPDEEQK